MTTSTQLNIPHRRRRSTTVCLAAVALVVGVPSPAPAAPLQAPTRVEAIASPGSVRLTFIGPDDGSRVDSFRITASTGAVFQAEDAPVTLAPLANGVAVTFRVAAVRAGVVGQASAASAAVTPRATTASNTWARTGRLRQGRIGASSVRLRDGQVLAVGGSSSGGPSDRPRRTAELYDPATRTWRATGSMDLDRSDFSTTLLPDGRVLVAGGQGESGLRASTRLYDPATGRWSRGGRMTTLRTTHTATLLGNGKVLVAGGFTGAKGPASRTAELYDPKTDRWSRTTSMRTARSAAGAVRLGDGQVLMVGGTGNIFGGGLPSSELYDPGKKRWTGAGGLKTVRTDEYWCCRDGLVLLANGKVLLAGGFGGQRGRGAELFDPATRIWKVTGQLSVAREEGYALIGLGAGALALGGSDDFGPLKYAELYEARTGRWTRVNDLRHDRYAPLAVRLANGQVLVAGGSTRSGTRRSSELFSLG